MNLEKDEVASKQVYTKVSSKDDTCYLIYRKTQVTTLGLDNKYVRISKYRGSIYLSGDSLLTQPLTSAHSTLPYILDNSDPFSVTLCHTP